MKNSRTYRSGIYYTGCLVFIILCSSLTALLFLVRTREINTATFEVRKSLKLGSIPLYEVTENGPLGRVGADISPKMYGEWLVSSQTKLDGEISGTLPYGNLEKFLVQVAQYWAETNASEARREQDRIVIRDVLRRHRQFWVDEDGIHEGRGPKAAKSASQSGGT